MSSQTSFGVISWTAETVFLIFVVGEPFFEWVCAILLILYEGLMRLDESVSESLDIVSPLNLIKGSNKCCDLFLQFSNSVPWYFPGLYPVTWLTCHENSGPRPPIGQSWLTWCWSWLWLVAMIDVSWRVMTRIDVGGETQSNNYISADMNWARQRWTVVTEQGWKDFSCK